MLAKTKMTSIHDYVSDRVYDGKRPIPAGRRAKRKSKKHDDSKSAVGRAVVMVTRFFRFT